MLEIDPFEGGSVEEIDRSGAGGELQLDGRVVAIQGKYKLVKFLHRVGPDPPDVIQISVIISVGNNGV